MHGLSDVDWLHFESGSAGVLVPEVQTDGGTEDGLPMTRRVPTIDSPAESSGDAFPQVLGDARDPDEEEDEDDLDYLYDDDDDDLDDDADDDLDDFDDDEDDFDDEDDDL